jgi:hypothetical protein
MGWAARKGIGRTRYVGAPTITTKPSRQVRRAKAFIKALDLMPRFESNGRLISRGRRRQMARLRARASE